MDPQTKPRRQIFLGTNKITDSWLTRVDYLTNTVETIKHIAKNHTTISNLILLSHCKNDQTLFYKILKVKKCIYSTFILKAYFITLKCTVNSSYCTIVNIINLTKEVKYIFLGSERKEKGNGFSADYSA